MTPLVASSSTALANLAYLIGAVVVAVIGGLLVWLHHRQPKSADANIASFRRGLSALAPDPGSPLAAGRRADERGIRPVPLGLHNVRVANVRVGPGTGGPGGSPAGEPPFGQASVEETDAHGIGGQPG